MRYKKQLQYVVAIIVAAIAGPFIGSQLARLHNRSSSRVPMTAVPTNAPEFLTNVERQDAQGLTDQTYTSDLLKNQERFLVNTFIEKGKENYVAEGRPASEWRPWVDSSSAFVEANGHKFGIIKMNMVAGPLTESLVRVVTVQDSKLISVACLQRDVDSISLTKGPCFHKIQETFGVVLSQSTGTPRLNAASE